MLSMQTLKLNWSFITTRPWNKKTKLSLFGDRVSLAVAVALYLAY